MHNGHLTFNNEKMSKSIGNVILVKDFLRAHDPNLLRLIFMTTSFTQPLDLTDDLINQGEKFFIKLTNLQKKAKQAFALDQLVREEATGENLVTFRTYMNDNLNTPMVLTLIEQMIKEINTCLSEGKLIGA
jgi:cysteinyl-tRNA synthetase